MPTIEENKKNWGGYDWPGAGDEWSVQWGSAEMQWYGSLLPRIHRFVPTGSILEIAPGYGRWTVFLKDLCRKLTLVDLSENCIEACRKRFAPFSHISYFVNDGTSLAMVPDNSTDFVFSFDSLVHAEDTVLAAYVSQFARLLTKDGAAFIHHSNLGAYAKNLAFQKKVAKVRGLTRVLIGLGAIEDLTLQWRAPSMTGEKLRLFCEQNGLECISQEFIPWVTKNALIDCMSVIVRKESAWSRNYRKFDNPLFMKQADHLAELARLYGR
jgi:ubiquinone/menaquinone biosynthesis C-methylase UbiE